jgi:hypothetical protein
MTMWAEFSWLRADRPMELPSFIKGRKFLMYRAALKKDFDP